MRLSGRKVTCARGNTATHNATLTANHGYSHCYPLLPSATHCYLLLLTTSHLNPLLSTIGCRATATHTSKPLLPTLLPTLCCEANGSPSRATLTDTHLHPLHTATHPQGEWAFEQGDTATHLHPLLTATPAAHPQGEWVFEQGDAGDSFFIIIEGEATVLRSEGRSAKQAA